MESIIRSYEWYHECRIWVAGSRITEIRGRDMKIRSIRKVWELHKMVYSNFWQIIVGLHWQRLGSTVRHVGILCQWSRHNYLFFRRCFIAGHNDLDLLKDDWGNPNHDVLKFGLVFIPNFSIVPEEFRQHLSNSEPLTLPEKQLLFEQQQTNIRISLVCV